MFDICSVFLSVAVYQILHQFHPINTAVISTFALFSLCSFDCEDRKPLHRDIGFLKVASDGQTVSLVSAQHFGNSIFLIETNGIDQLGPV